MKRYLILFAVLIALVFVGLSANTGQASGVLIDFINVSDGDQITLAVGETYTFEVQVQADQPFTSALLLSDEQFPGRGIFLNGADIAVQTDSAVLQLTATGKNSTAGLPGGTAPVALVVGVRYPGGIVIADQVVFSIQVP